MDKKLKLTAILLVKAVLRGKSCYSRVYPVERHVRQDQSGQIEDLASDIQYILQTLTEVDERLQKIESHIDQGSGTVMNFKLENEQLV